MLQMKIEFVGYTQFQRKHVRSAMGKGARVVAAELKRSVNRRGGGRVYQRRGGSHNASAPGQPPARFTGNLFRSMQGRASRRGYAIVVSAFAQHARMLELGWRSAAPRPAFEPAFTRKGGDIVGLLRTAVSVGLTATSGEPGRAPAEVEVG